MARASSFAGRACLVAAVVLLAVYAAQVLPRARFTAPPPTRWVIDRHGAFLAQFADRVDGRDEYGFWAIDAAPPRVAQATLALEDRRFAAHPGVDARAVLRAVWQHLQGGRSGASTIAMQVARMQHPAPRTLWAKAVEAGTAMALTWRYGREEVLAQYLRLVPYGNGSHGIAHAARFYFDQPVADLSWAEIALLAAIPQAPGTMNLRRPAGLTRARGRGQRILTELSAQGVIPGDELAVARAQLAVLQPAPAQARPVVALSALQRLQAVPAAGPQLRSTLDLAIQTRVTDLARQQLDRWRSQGAQQVAVMVTRRRSREVLAAIGSAGFDTPAGRIDFTTASRSPGSTLKPFVYAMALQQGVLSPATVMLDLPDRAAGIGNADGGYLGPLLPRQALANSRNVPAVTLLRQVGLPAMFEQLRALGLHDLPGPAGRYGLSMAIGALPTSLDRLMHAYAILSEDGEDGDLRWLASQPSPPARRLIPLPIARQVTAFLADPMARLPSFPRYGSSEYPFAVAEKTGTSQGYRDAWVVAWSQLYQVGVWVGRADAGPMTRLSGAEAAGSLAQAILLELHGATRGDLTAGDFPTAPGTAPVELCTTTGRPAAAGCAMQLTEQLSARPVLAADMAPPLSITAPEPNTRLWRNPDVPAAMQVLVLRARAGAGTGQVLWLVDGKPFALAAPDAPVTWPLQTGAHSFQLRLPLATGLSRSVHIVVE